MTDSWVVSKQQSRDCCTLKFINIPRKHDEIMKVATETKEEAVIYFINYMNKIGGFNVHDWLPDATGEVPIILERLLKEQPHLFL